MEPPRAPARPVTTEHHGRTRVDEYDWLRDKESPEVVAHLEAENAWTEHRTAHLADLRDRIFEEIRARTQETDLSVPIRVRDHWYYGRTFEGREYGASCRVPVHGPDDWTPPVPDEAAGPDRPALPGEEVLLDLDALAEGHEFFSLGGSSVSPDGRLLAYSTDVVGDERYTIRVKDLATGELHDEIEGVIGGATWDRAGEHLYYTTVDAAWRSDKIWRHRLGTPQDDDELVHHETDERFFVGVGRSNTDRFVMIAAGSKTTSEFRFLDADDPEPGFVVFCPRQEGLEYSIDHAVLGGEDRFLVTHNATGPDFEVGVAPIGPSGPEEWTALVPHDPSVRLEGLTAHAGHLVLSQRSGGLTQLRILELDPTSSGSDDPAAVIADEHLVEFDHEIYPVGAGANPGFERPTVRVGYTTMAVPSTVYDYDLASRRLTLLKQAVVLGGYDPHDYEEHRLWATAEDGEQIPISLVVRRDARADEAPVPVLLYGYGAYEHSLDPYFSVARLSLLDRGAAFAMAHVRGGGEMGRRWYDEGKMLAKTNTFDDFVACARHLVDTGWTRPGQVVAEGASAGGLLVGAVANRAPELFGGVVAGVPFVDNLTTMLDATLPLTVTEYDEWGDPAADPEVFDYIAGYAPYDNVAAERYPPILAETSFHDTRVLFVEPAKWVARLRERIDNPDDVLFRIEMAAGHGGVSGRYKSWRDRAFSLAWILDRMGLANS
jgi:oligopeptidase B